MGLFYNALDGPLTGKKIIGIPAKPSKALVVNAAFRPNRSASHPTKTVTAAVVKKLMPIYNPFAAPL